MFRMQDKKKETIVKLGSSSIPYRKKSTARQRMNRNSKKYNKREDQPKEYRKNIQDIERSMVEYWSKKGRYIWRHNSQSTLGQWCDRDIYRQKDSNKIWIQAIKAKKTSISKKCKQYK